MMVVKLKNIFDLIMVKILLGMDVAHNKYFFDDHMLDERSGPVSICLLLLNLCLILLLFRKGKMERERETEGGERERASGRERAREGKRSERSAK